MMPRVEAKKTQRASRIRLVNASEIEEATRRIETESFNGDTVSCPFCTKNFARKYSLVTHLKNHAVEKKYLCVYCQKGFTQAANLRNHERIHRNERPYVCKDCGKAFTQITNLNNHRRLHTGERPFVCIENNCGRSFAQVTNLNNHMKTHHKVQQYVCNQCPSRFAQVTQLNLHLATHADLLVCPHCPEQVFRQQYQLQQHLKQHGVNYAYACGQCEEKFMSLVHLDKHRKVHDELRYKCTMCTSSFNQEVLLKKHIQRHIDGRYLTCPVDGCDEGFTIKSQLARHMQTHHSIENCTQRISVKRLRMTNYVRSAASGKHNCYFESCEGSFSDVDSLNNHLRGVHGLSILKNAGKSSKMDLMLEEQMKQQQRRKEEEQGDPSIGQDHGYSQGQGGPSASTSTSSSSSSFVQPDVSHLVAAADNDSSALLGCSYCYQVFRTEDTLSRHEREAHTLDDPLA